MRRGRPIRKSRTHLARWLIDTRSSYTALARDLSAAVGVRVALETIIQYDHGRRPAPADIRLLVQTLSGGAVPAESWPYYRS